MPSRDGNIAVKVAWNNQNYQNPCIGPDSKEYWRANHPSCFYKRIDIDIKIKQGKCQSTCWEQGLFRDWQADIIYNRHAKSIKEGKIAFFVTKKPRTNYKTVIGFMVIKEIAFLPEWTTIIGDKKTALKIDPNINDIKYEDFDPRRWNQGLYRYISDEVALRILERIKFNYEKSLGVIGIGMQNIIE